MIIKTNDLIEKNNEMIIVLIRKSLTTMSPGNSQTGNSLLIVTICSNRSKTDQITVIPPKYNYS